MAQRVKNLPAMQETQEMWARSLGQEDPLELYLFKTFCVLHLLSCRGYFSCDE